MNAPAPPAQRLSYSPTEAAWATGLSLPTINRKIARGELRSVKVGRRRLIPAQELERLCGVQTTPVETANA